MLGNIRESDGLSQVGRFIDVSLQQDGWNSGTTNPFLNLFYVMNLITYSCISNLECIPFCLPVGVIVTPAAPQGRLKDNDCLIVANHIRWLEQTLHSFRNLFENLIIVLIK